jgi:hypothetical protein
VIFHYQGNTRGDRKNLAHEQVRPLLDLCLEAGYVPIVLDWDRRSFLFDNRRVFNSSVHSGDLWGGFGSGDAETIAALVSLANRPAAPGPWSRLQFSGHEMSSRGTDLLRKPSVNQEKFAACDAGLGAKIFFLR